MAEMFFYLSDSFMTERGVNLCVLKAGF